MIPHAQSIAETTHQGRFTKYDRPYIERVSDRVQALREHGHQDDELLMAAGWLFDVVELTDCEFDQLQEQFDSDLVQLVWRVTPPEDDSKDLLTKAESSERASTLVVADRFVTLREAIDHQDDVRVQTLCQEHPSFYQRMYTPFCEDLWEDVNTLVEQVLVERDFRVIETGG